MRAGHQISPPMKARTKNSILLDGGRFALGVLIGVFASIALYLGLDLFSVGFTRTEILDVLPALLTLLVALVSLILSFHALSEQKRMRQAGTDPVVIVHLGSREDARIMSTLEISNVGAGAALNVTVDLKTDISAFVPERIITDFTNVRQVFRTIPQDKSVSFNFGLGFKLLGEPPIPPIEFLVYYEDIDGTKHGSKQIIDISELALQRADEGLDLRQAKALERVAKSLDGMQSNKPIKAVTQTKREQRADRREFIEEIKQDIKKDK